MKFTYKKKGKCYWIKNTEDDSCFSIPQRHYLTQFSYIDYTDEMIEDLVDGLNTGRIPIVKEPTIPEASKLGRVEYSWNLTPEESEKIYGIIKKMEE